LPQDTSQGLISAEAVFKIEPEKSSVPPGHGFKLSRLRLGEINHPLVVAKILRQQLGMSIQAKTNYHQSPEVADKKIREVETAGLFCSELREYITAGKELIAMRSRQTLDMVFGEHRIQLSTGTAVAVGNEYPLIFFTCRDNCALNSGYDLPRAIVQVWWKALEIDLLPPVLAFDPHQFPGYGATGNHE